MGKEKSNNSKGNNGLNATLGSLVGVGDNSSGGNGIGALNGTSLNNLSNDANNN